MPTPHNLLSRRTVLRAAAGAAVAAAGLTAAGLAEGARRGRPAAAGVPAADSSGFAPSARVGPGVQVSHDAFVKHYEPSVAVNPRNQRDLLGCCTVLTGAGLTGSQQLTATYASFDGGATWASNGPMPGSAGLYFVNATAGFDTQGRGYVIAVAGRAPNTQDVGVLVWRTDDGGRTFRPPVAAFSGLADHPWLAASTTGRSSGPLHVIWYGAAGVCYTRSTNGGRTFDTARTLAPQPTVGWPMAAAGPDGTVHVAYVGPARSTAAGRSLPLYVISSCDDGASFGAPVAVTEQTPQPQAQPGGPELGKSNPVIAASPRDGSVYLASVHWQEGAGHTDIMISASRDGGRTWAAAVPVTPADQVTYYSPKLAVDQAGRLGVFCYGLVPGGIDPLLIVAQPDLANISAPARLTDRPFSPTAGVPVGGAYLWGDYQGIAASGTTFHPFWADGQTGQMQIRTAAAHMT